MSSVLGKRPAEGVLDNEPETKEARTEPVVCLHIDPNIELVYESKPEDEQKIKEKVLANKTLLSIHFKTFEEYFTINKECKQYEFPHSYDEWKIFIKMIENMYSIRDGTNNITIDVININNTMMKLYGIYQLKPEILESIISRSIQQQFKTLNPNFFPMHFRSGRFPLTPGPLNLSDDSILILQTEIKKLRKIAYIYKDWNGNNLYNLVKGHIENIFNKITTMGNHVNIFKAIYPVTDEHCAFIIWNILAKIYIGLI